MRKNLHYGRGALVRLDFLVLYRDKSVFLSCEFFLGGDFREDFFLNDSIVIRRGTNVYCRSDLSRKFAS